MEDVSYDLLMKNKGKRIKIVSNTGAVHKRIGEECTIVGVFTDLYMVSFDDGDFGVVQYRDVEFI